MWGWDNIIPWWGRWISKEYAIGPVCCFRGWISFIIIFFLIKVYLYPPISYRNHVTIFFSGTEWLWISFMYLLTSSFACVNLVLCYAELDEKAIPKNLLKFYEICFLFSFLICWRQPSGEKNQNMLMHIRIQIRIFLGAFCLLTHFVWLISSLTTQTLGFLSWPPL